MTANPDIAIRELEAGDTERLVEIALAAWTPVFSSFRDILGPELFDLTRPDCRKEKADQIRKACQADSPAKVLVAQNRDGMGRDGMGRDDMGRDDMGRDDMGGDIIAGFVSYYPEAREPGVAEIGNNAVHPDFQNRGIAQMMYQEVFQRLRSEGIQFVKVHTGGDPSHLPARLAYEKAGFNISLPGVEYYRRL
jgi:ribosomal protein S18 acetylase RimI-like enzyme